MKKFSAFSLYGKIQESRLTESIPLLCTSGIWASILYFHVLSPLRAHRWEWLQAMAARWQVFSPSWVPSGLTIPGRCICWWQWPPLLTDVRVLDFFLSTNDISNFLKDLYHPGSIYVLTSAKVTPHICHGPCYSQAQQVWIQLCRTEHETFNK